MLSMRAWDRLRTRTNAIYVCMGQTGAMNDTILLYAIYACMGQTTLSTLCNVDTHEAPSNRCFFICLYKSFYNNNS